MRKAILLAGAGRWGSVFLKNLEDHPGLRTAGLVTQRDRREVPHLPDDAKIFRTFEEALSAGGWHGAILATPPELHAGQLDLCLAAKVPVLVEKPLTSSLAEARHLNSRHGDARHSVLVNHTFLFNRGYEKLKELVASSGPVKKILAEGGNSGPYRTYSALWNYGAHDVSMILDLLRENPASLEATVSRLGARDGGLAGDYAVTLRFPSGAEASFRASNVAAGKMRRLEVLTPAHLFLLDDVPTARLTRTLLTTGATEEIPLAGDPPLTNVLRSFREGIDGRPDGRWGLAAGVRVVEVLGACERALTES